MIEMIRADWSRESLLSILKAVKGNRIIVPVALGAKGVSDRITIVEKAVKERHPAIKALKGAGFVLFTSGTTGAPKAVLHDFDRFYSKFRKPGKSYRTIMFLLFDHIGGWNTAFYTITSGGYPIFLNGNRQVDMVCKKIEQEKAELLPATPTFLNMLLYMEMHKRYDLSSLRLITYGTEPMPPATLEAMRNILPDVQFKQTYGLSEIGILSTKSESDSTWVKVGGTGYETKIKEGILWIRSQTSMVGYLNAPSPFDDEGWYCTGDRVEQRADGYIRFLGRKTEVINVGGSKVSPIEIENEILKIPGVKDVEVHGEPNELMGQVVVATVATDKEGMDVEVIKWCRRKLGKSQAPARVRIVREIGITDRYKKIHSS